ncbi:MAG: hypothetical protein ABSB49_19895 [Polyangia bacterium]|jgi:putative colanic acid biosynthesis UDP-glucose lipid carrier transferase
MKVTRAGESIDILRSFARAMDVAVIVAGQLLACHLVGQPWSGTRQSTAVFAIVVFCLMAELAGLYTSDLAAPSRLALRVWTVSLPVLTLFLLVTGEWQATLVAGWATAAALGVYGWRWGLRKCAGARAGQGRALVLLGATAAAERLCTEIRRRPWLRTHVAGVYDDRNVDRAPAALLPLYRGRTQELILACKQGSVETVVIALPPRAQARIRSVVDALADTTATVLVLTDLLGLDVPDAPWTAIGNLPLISLGACASSKPGVGWRGIATAIIGRAFRPGEGRLAPALASERRAAVGYGEASGQRRRDAD